MSTTCAKCHKKFKGIYPLFLYWQEEDEHFLCGRCWTLGKNKESHPGGSASGYVLVGVFVLLLLSIGLLFLHQDLQKQEWSQLDTTPVAELEEGELARVEGTIQGSPDEILLGGREQHLYEDSYYWSWDRKARLTVEDQGNTTVTALTEEYRHIEFGKHKAPNRDETDAKVYKGNDSVVMVGTLEKEGNGTVFLIHWMGPAGSDPGPKWYFSGGATAGAVALALAAVWAWGTKKLKHNKRAKYDDPVDFTGDWQLEKGELDWQRNWNFTRGYLGFVLAFYLPTLLVGWAVFASHGQMSFKEMERPFFLGMLASIVPAMAVLLLDIKYKLFLRNGKNTPAWVALSDRGVHLFSPHPEFLDRELVEWEDIYPRDDSQGECEELAWDVEGLKKDEIVFDQLKPGFREKVLEEYLKRGKPGVEKHRLKMEEEKERRKREEAEAEERKRELEEQETELKGEIEEIATLPDGWDREED